MNSSLQSGFTLLELLVALSIFSLIGLGAFHLSTQLTHYQQRSADQMQQFQALSTMLNLMEQDLWQALDRPVRDEFGDQLKAFHGDTESLQFTHAAHRHYPMASLTLYKVGAELQRTEYRLESDYQYGSNLRVWTRNQWDVLDRVQHSEPQETLKIAVQHVTISYLSHDYQWLTHWPYSGSTQHKGYRQPLPQAIELQLITENFGTITRLIEVAR